MWLGVLAHGRCWERLVQVTGRETDDAEFGWRAGPLANSFIAERTGVDHSLRSMAQSSLVCIPRGLFSRFGAPVALYLNRGISQ
jgi:hypothetical protein